MSRAWLPRQESEALSVMRLLARKICKHYALYKLTAADAQKVKQAVEQYSAAYKVASNRASRSQVDVMIKDERRAAAERICRSYYSRIKFNDEVSNTTKKGAGIRPVNRNRVKIMVSIRIPKVNIDGAVFGVHNLRYTDRDGGPSTILTSKRIGSRKKRGKPNGASQFHLYIAISDQPEGDHQVSRLYGVFTRNRMRVNFEHKDDGRFATYWGRWVSQRGELGPWSPPTSMRIAA
jgi:hypothetical protein